MVDLAIIFTSQRNTMPHAGETLYDGEYGTCNPSFSFSEKPGMYTLHAIPPGPGSDPPGVAATPDTHIAAMEAVHKPTNNISAPTKHPCSSPGSPSATVHVSSPYNPAPEEKNASSPDSEALANTSPGSMTFDFTPCTCLDSEPMEITPSDDFMNPASPSSQSSVPWSKTRIASAEIEKPLCKPCVKTPPDSPLQPSPIPRAACTPLPTPDHAALKATLVHIDTSPTDTPLATPQRTSISLSIEMAQFSASLDETDQSQLPAEAACALGPTQDRRPSANSGDTQDGREAGGRVDDGFPGDEEADKSNGGEDEFELEDEALLRALMRCNPYLLTFSKWRVCNIAGSERVETPKREWRLGEDGWSSPPAAETSLSRERDCGWFLPHPKNRSSS